MIGYEEDLSLGVIRFIGDISENIKEDFYLNLIRFDRICFRG